MSIKPHNLNSVEKTLIEPLKSLWEKTKFISIFFNETVRKAQFDKFDTYVWLKYET